MRECWQHTAEERPTFHTLTARLDAILDDLSDDPHANVHVAQMHENMFDILRNPPGEKC